MRDAMQYLKEGKDNRELTFAFPRAQVDGALVDCAAPYDKWRFFIDRFNSAFGGAKGVDFVYLDSEGMWLIEVKDYRAPDYAPACKIDPPPAPKDLADVVSLKVRDSLTGLMVAQCSAADADERRFARRASSSEGVRVVVHVEFPADALEAPRHADIQLALQMRLKGVDDDPLVVDRNNGQLLPWTVQAKQP